MMLPPSCMVPSSLIECSWINKNIFLKERTVNSCVLLICSMGHRGRTGFPWLNRVLTSPLLPSWASLWGMASGVHTDSSWGLRKVPAYTLRWGSLPVELPVVLWWDWTLGMGLRGCLAPSPSCVQSLRGRPGGWTQWTLAGGLINPWMLLGRRWHLGFLIVKERTRRSQGADSNHYWPPFTYFLLRNSGLTTVPKLQVMLYVPSEWPMQTHSWYSINIGWMDGWIHSEDLVK